MKHALIWSSFLVLTVGIAFQGCSQTGCVWIVESENGSVLQKAGISVNVLQLLAKTGGTWDVDGRKMSFDTLLTIYRDGSTVHINQPTGEETEIYAGRFDEAMKESSEKHNNLIMESTDSGGATKISKVRVESVEAVGIVLAMIGSKNLDADIDAMESSLERGGVLYIRDYRHDSRLWIYVN